MRLPLPQLASQSHPPNHIAEVIETSTTEFLAQCLEPDSLSFAQMPPFGSWVKAADEDSGNQIFGVVYHATTSPLDSVHRATALGLSLAELREQQPQIFAMLKTEFRVAIVGFQPAGNEAVYQHLPPRPPQVHQAVYHCESAEVVAFTEQLALLRPLMDMRRAPVDGLIAGRILNVLLKDDYDRLRIILAQIHP